MNVLYLLPLPDDIITKILLYDENYVLIQGRIILTVKSHKLGFLIV